MLATELPPQLAMSRAIVLQRMLRQEVEHGRKIEHADTLASARELGFKGRSKSDVLRKLNDWLESKWNRIYRPDVVA